jgi:hypothetical protein
VVERCILCEKPRIVASEFCDFHTEIGQAIRRSYKVWFEAYNRKLSENDFLMRILTLSETGEQAKRVANNLLAKGGESPNVEHTSGL